LQKGLEHFGLENKTFEISFEEFFNFLLFTFEHFGHENIKFKKQWKPLIGVTLGTDSNNQLMTVRE